MNTKPISEITPVDIENNPAVNDSKPKIPQGNTTSLDTTNIENRTIATTEATSIKQDIPTIQIELTPCEFHKLLESMHKFPEKALLYGQLFEKPFHLVVTGDLDILDNSLIKTIIISSHIDSGIKFPQQMTVKGNFTINLQSKMNITLPEVLNVEKSFRIDKGAIAKLPKVLNVGDTFTCENIPITKIDTKLTASKVEVINCYELTEITNSIEVKNELFIYNCPKLANLPTKEMSLKELSISCENKLKQLPTNISMEKLTLGSIGELEVTDMSKITKELFMLHCNGSMVVAKDQSFSIPNLKLMFCKDIVNIKNISVTNKLLIINCKGIKSIEDLPIIQGKIDQIVIEREVEQDPYLAKSYLKDRFKQQYNNLPTLEDMPDISEFAYHSDTSTKEEFKKRLHDEIYSFELEISPYPEVNSPKQPKLSAYYSEAQLQTCVIL